jgi:hypothetical protein
MPLSDAMTYSADVGTMLTGIAVATATWTWVSKQYREHQVRKAEHSLRSWTGYVAPLSLLSRIRLNSDYAEVGVKPRNCGLALSGRGLLTRDSSKWA